MASHPIADEERLIEKWIEPDPWKPGVEEARVKPFSINVWAIIGHLAGDERNIEAVAHSYDISAESVEAAVAYYHRHKDFIDYRLAQNNAW